MQFVSPSGRVQCLDLQAFTLSLPVPHFLRTAPSVEVAGARYLASPWTRGAEKIRPESGPSVNLATVTH